MGVFFRGTGGVISKILYIIINNYYMKEGGWELFFSIHKWETAQTLKHALRANIEYKNRICLKQGTGKTLFNYEQLNIHTHTHIRNKYH